MAGEGSRRLDANTEAAMKTALDRFRNVLRQDFNQMFRAKPVSLEERGKEWMTIAGDVPAIRDWAEKQAAIHGTPAAMTLLFQLRRDGDKFINKVLADNEMA